MLDQPVADNVPVVESDDPDAVDAAQHVDHGYETRIFTTRQVDLRHVARHDEARVAPHTRKEHLELRDGRVLRFVQNHEGVVERAAAHERERSDLHRPVLHEAAELRGGDHIVQRVVQRLQIRIEFLLHVAGQEAQLLAGLDGRARQNDTLDLPVAQRADGQRDGRIRLARAGRPDGEKQVVPLGEPQQPLLIDRPGPDDETGVSKQAILSQLNGALQAAARRSYRKEQRDLSKEGIASDIRVPYTSSGESALGAANAARQLAVAMLQDPEQVPYVRARLDMSTVLVPEMQRALEAIFRCVDEHLPLNQTSLQQMLDEAAFRQLAHGQAYNHDIRLQRQDIDMYLDRLQTAKPISEQVKGMSDGQLESYFANLGKKKGARPAETDE